MKIIMNLFLSLFLLSGCTAQKRVVNQKKLPRWYENPMQNTYETLYAVSEGDTKTTAINRALSEILATLSVSISSEFKSKTEVTKGAEETYTMTSSNEVQSKVQKIRISNYEVISSEDFGFERYLVQVKVEKKKLYHSLEKELEQKFKMIENTNQEAENYNAIKRLNTYTKNLESIDYMNNTLAVMHALNTNFDDSRYVQKIIEIENKYELLLSKISFSIHSNTDALNLKSSISKGLSSKKYKVNKTKNVNHFKVYLSSKTTQASSYGFDLARSAIFITVKDYKGNILGSNKLNITGQSTQGYKIAKENVAIKLNEMIKKNGISKIIGLDI